jgi:hypothetical protein
MTPCAWRAFLLLIGVALTVGACGDRNPTTPENHSPVIVSVSAFPSTIHRADSALVIVDATDADGDTLVYDWTTDARLRISGARFSTYLYNTL